MLEPVNVYEVLLSSFCIIQSDIKFYQQDLLQVLILVNANITQSIIYYSYLALKQACPSHSLRLPSEH